MNHPTTISIPRPLSPEQHRLARAIQGLAADPRRRGEGLNLDAVRRRHPALLDAVYAVKPFWGWRQALAAAGLDYADIPVELLDHVTCRICGQPAGILTAHLTHAHAVTTDEYREEFPGAELMAETVRAARSHSNCYLARAGAPFLPHWEPLWTPEYVLDRLAELARRGLPLHSHWIGEHDQSLLTRAITCFGSWDATLLRVGLSPAAIRRVVPARHLSAAEVLDGLRARRAAALSLNETAMVREDLCLLNAARRRFGSYPKALATAGIDPASVRLRPHKDPDAVPRIQRLLAGVRALLRITDGGRQRKAWARLRAKYQPMVSRQGRRGLGGWCQVFQLAGVGERETKHLLGRRPCVRPYIGRQAVLSALRQRLARGEPVNAKAVYLVNRPLFTEVLREFGGSFTPVYALFGLPVPKHARHKAKLV